MPWAETSFSQSERRPPYHIQEASFCVKSCKCKCKICRYLLQHYCPSSQAARQWVSFDGRPLTGSFQSSHWLIKEKGYCQKISCNIHMPDALVRKQSSPLMRHKVRNEKKITKIIDPTSDEIPSQIIKRKSMFYYSKFQRSLIDVNVFWAPQVP